MQSNPYPLTPPNPKRIIFLFILLFIFTQAIGSGPANKMVMGERPSGEARPISTPVAFFALGEFGEESPASTRTQDGDEADKDARLADDKHAAELLLQYCGDCHGNDITEADLNLIEILESPWPETEDEAWQRILEVVQGEQMPPPDADQPSLTQRRLIHDSLHRYLKRRAARFAGDPGPVVLRRLSNSEYEYAIADLSGLPSLGLTREFPVDGAAGEGFTNVGDALVMSPTLLTKYVGAAKQFAEHTVLLPDGIRFSSHHSRIDWTAEYLDQIREFYRVHTDGGPESGKIPLKAYLVATIEERDALRNGSTSIFQVATERALNRKYLERLWHELESDETTAARVPFDAIRQLWEESSAEQVDLLVAEIVAWQEALSKFNTVGHIGRANGPESWLEPVNPIDSSIELEFDLPEDVETEEIFIGLHATLVGNKERPLNAVWRRPRVALADGLSIPLAQLADLERRIANSQRDALLHTGDYLRAILALETGRSFSEAGQPDGRTTHLDLELELDLELDEQSLARYLDYLGAGNGALVPIDNYFERRIERAGGHAFVNGWGVNETPQILANSSEQQVRIPGILPPKSVAFHPSPSMTASAGWRCVESGTYLLSAQILDAHPECGNGVAWLIEHRFGSKNVALAEGEFGTAGKSIVEPLEVNCVAGDLISLHISPRDGNHYCDLTQVTFTIQQMAADATPASGAISENSTELDQNTEIEPEQVGRRWDLGTDVAEDLSAFNPQPDQYGNDDVWHFYQMEVDQLRSRLQDSLSIPAGSLLHAWKDADTAEAQEAIVKSIDELVRSENLAAYSEADRQLREHLVLLARPTNLSELLKRAEVDPRFGNPDLGQTDGFSQNGPPTDSSSEIELDLISRGGTSEYFRLPRRLVAGGKVRVRCEAWDADKQESELASALQFSLSIGEHPTPQLSSTLPIICPHGDAAGEALERGFQAFRELFPSALCYSRVVPVDEVVTLNLFYREDTPLQDLMLDEVERAELERLWDELLYVSQEPLRLLVAFEQISEFATQDRPDLVVAFQPLRESIEQRAESYRQRLRDTESIHRQAVLNLASRAWRRALLDSEKQELEQLYHQLRLEQIDHEAAIRLLITRVLVSPNFLYRRERSPQGERFAHVSDTELASRLSFFLWSSIPDEELSELAAANELRQPGVLREQMRRMLDDPKASRMAIEFGCQWLHVRDFDQNDGKNEALYPEFVELRELMYTETRLFWEQLFRENRPVLDLLDADYAFVNERLAKHYGIPDVVGDDFRQVVDVRRFERGGLLGMGAILASQSGASRTSPILRGNWIYETILGRKLPRPPANVPVLPDTLPEELTARQLIEQHSEVEACAKCHRKIDPFGFALESFDAIGRVRSNDALTETQLEDGKSIDGVSELKEYLVNDRRDEFVRQFCRKLLGYALGRSVQLSDEPLLEQMQAALEAEGYRVHAAIETIVLSLQFQQIRAQDFDPLQ